MKNREMRIISQLTEIASYEPTVLTIGFFDGVHRGHQEVIRHVAAYALQQGLQAALVTFWPHPQHVLNPEQLKPLLTTLQEKLELLAGLEGLDMVVVMPFTAQLAQLTPWEFLELLRTHFQLRAVIVGADFAFGHHRAGDIAWLQQAGKELDFTVEALTVVAGEKRISSTRIRELITAGRVEEAATLLGRPYTVAGTVVKGKGRGRELGFPTANLSIDPVKLLPADGVYAVYVQLLGDDRPCRPAIAYVGSVPSFGAEHPRVVEVHLFDVQVDLYGQQLLAEFVAHLREDRHFHSLEALQAQMRDDADQALLRLAPRQL